MNKEQIIENLKALSSIYTNDEMLNEIRENLKEGILYDFDKIGDSLKISSKIIPNKNGNYTEVVISYNKELKNKSLVIVNKEYCPSYQSRYGFVGEEGMNIFTQANSFVYNGEDKLLHQSWFSDENKYYGADKMPLSYSEENLKKYFEETNPVFEKGYFKEGPISSYQPFTTVWQRYGLTNVIRKYGRNPMNGEFSTIGITLGENFSKYIELLSESYGKIYRNGREMKIEGTENIISKINEIYLASQTMDGFDLDKFNIQFDDELFEPKRRSY